MRKIKVNSKTLMEALIAKGVSVWFASKETGISLTNFHKYLQRDKVIQAPTAKKLIEYFGEQVVYIDEGRAESGTESARSSKAEGKSPSALERILNGIDTCAGRHADGERLDFEGRSLDDESN